jgi:hypothetical protein
MLGVRLVLVLGALLIGGSLATYVLTRNRRYLAIAWQTFKFAIVVLTLIVLFLFIERLA